LCVSSSRRGDGLLVAVASAPTPAQLNSLRSRLQRLHEELLGDLEQLEQDVPGAPDQPAERQGDAGSSDWDRETDLDLLEADDTIVREVVDALARIEAGTYGRCEACARWIGIERLTVVPYARRCVRCESGPRRPAP
jgi:RNA polymerase-binding transcription factor DksA